MPTGHGGLCGHADPALQDAVAWLWQQPSHPAIASSTTCAAEVVYSATPVTLRVASRTGTSFADLSEEERHSLEKFRRHQEYDRRLARKDAKRAFDQLEAAKKKQTKESANMHRPYNYGNDTVLRPLIKQVGDSLGLNHMSKNFVVSTSLRSQVSRFFCVDPKNFPRALPDTEHPEIKFAFPVKNVHVTLTDLGKADFGTEGAPKKPKKVPPKTVWDAGYATQADRIRTIQSDMTSDRGSARQFKPMCPPLDTPFRLEYHITADDPKTTDPPAHLTPPFPPPDDSPDRGVDEVVQMEVRLLREGDPRLPRFGGGGGAEHGERPPAPPWNLPFHEAAAPCGPMELALLGSVRLFSRPQSSTLSSSQQEFASSFGEGSATRSRRSGAFL